MLTIGMIIVVIIMINLSALTWWLTQPKKSDQSEENNTEKTKSQKLIRMLKVSIKILAIPVITLLFFTVGQQLPLFANAQAATGIQPASWLLVVIAFFAIRIIIGSLIRLITTSVLILIMVFLLSSAGFVDIRVDFNSERVNEVLTGVNQWSIENLNLDIQVFAGTSIEDVIPEITIFDGLEMAIQAILEGKTASAEDTEESTSP